LCLQAGTAQRNNRLLKLLPDSFTYGTSKQRMRWFIKGFESGDINQGDTFNS
jgi:predicted metalloprotease